MTALLHLLAFGFGIALPHWLITQDERRLSDIQARRAWPPATHWSAIIAFSWLCVPVHFVKTRRSASGLALGVLAFVCGVAAQMLILQGIERFVRFTS